jgi:predicted O-methyltransferase YrrM
MARPRQELEQEFRGLAPPAAGAMAGILAELEAEAAREAIPIVGPAVGRLLSVLAGATGARRVLELGAATGYSALHLMAGLGPGGRLLTLERDAGMARRARENLARAGFAGRAEVARGEAQELLAGLEPGWDMVLLDIDKGAYAPALAELERLVRPGGLLVADNTGFAGAAEFNRALAASPAWREANLLCFLPGHSPEWDGLALAVREGR